MNNTLTLAIIGHLVGDYLMQTDWMALNKKAKTLTGIHACWIHCILWECAVVGFAGWWSAPFAWPVLFLTHWIQDRTNIVLWWMNLRWKNQRQFASGPCAPWSIIVVDNVWHIVTIWAVWRFLV